MSLQDGDGGTLDLPHLVQSVVCAEWTAEVIGVELVRPGVAPWRREGGEGEMLGTASVVAPVMASCGGLRSNGCH
ncbi:hypothetical protein CFC21_016538 [Triticum aestivum]|uniref:Uncharacterized protein n=3 Tax=Triticum TaxID=4564 RepID=A0A9R1NR49_TRITD|nr:hypothetical protein CFC21_016538 [Triticum aestivum]VAH29453.1 unnamed protein product [Triticum turgidum subsp. durum]